jgi:hypothetical protein
VRDSDGHTPGQLFHQDTPPAAIAAIDRLLQSAVAAATGAQPAQARHGDTTAAAATAAASTSGKVTTNSGSTAVGGRLQQAQDAAARLREVVAGRGSAGRFNSTQVTRRTYFD